MISINSKAPVQCSKSISINANPEKVWAVLSNIDQWAAWQTDIRNPKLNGELQPGSSFVWTSGGATIHSTLHTVSPVNELGWSGKSFGIYAIHNWTILNLNGQTQVTVEESMEGILASLFRKAFNNTLNQSLAKWLELLKKECELNPND